MDYKYKLDYHLIAKRIKDARKLSGLTQEQLAEKIGISTNAVDVYKRQQPCLP